MKDLPYRVVAQVARGLMNAGGWAPAVTGSENIPLTGGAVLAANHLSYLDFIFVGWGPIFDRRRWSRFLAKKEVFDSKIQGPIMRSMDHISVDRKGEPRRALDLAVEALNKGELIAGFPEGSINKAGPFPGRGKTGSVRMAQATGTPLIPVAIWGSHRIFDKHRRPKIKRNQPVKVVIGPPMELDPSEDVRQATDRLMATLTEMVTQLKTCE